jgi:hypothetical protein
MRTTRWHRLAIRQGTPVAPCQGAGPRMPGRSGRPGPPAPRRAQPEGWPGLQASMQADGNSCELPNMLIHTHSSEFRVSRGSHAALQPPTTCLQPAAGMPLTVPAGWGSRGAGSAGSQSHRGRPGIEPPAGESCRGRQGRAAVRQAGGVGVGRPWDNFIRHTRGRKSSGNAP